jgi:hypothetical protein
MRIQIRSRGSWLDREVHTATMLSDLTAATAEQIVALGLDVPDDLAGVSVPLWRSSPKAKFHWADERSSCKHLPGNRHWQHPKNRPPPVVSDRMPALGFALSATSVCVSCADRITISTPADAFVAVVAELVRGRDWLESGRRGAVDASWTWLQFARWKARQPLVGAAWDEQVRVLRGKRWAATALSLRGVLAAQREEAEAVARQLAESIGDDPGRSAVLERAIRMVETESPVLEESATVLKISGCGHTPDSYADLFGPARLTYKQAEPWHVVAGIWRGKAKRGAAVDVAKLAADYLDDQFPHVHDLNALPCCGLHDPPFEAGDCVHTWALRTAQAHRRALVEQWVSRLDMAASGLLGAHQNDSDTCTHLVCILWWPLTHDGMDAIAYLSQFEVVCGPFSVERTPYDVSQVVVVRTPAWAAAHASELRSPLRSEPITDERRQAIVLVRGQGVAVVGDEFTARRKPSRLVIDARDDMDRSSQMGSSYYRHPTYRPLTRGAVPPAPYDNQPWSAHAVRHAIQGSEFVYGCDDAALLAMALPPDRHGRVEARVQIELQTRCARPYHDDEPHLCEVDGIIESARDNGTLVFTPHGMRDRATIPPAYIVGVTFR